MKRHPALHDYSRDHHFLLLQARSIRWHADESPHALPLEEIVVAFHDSWQHQILPHLIEEEAILLPYYQEHPVARSSHLARVHDDHEWLREKVARSEEHRPSGRQFRSALIAIGKRLHDHVRFEERVLFEYIQATWSDEELADFAARDRSYRLRHRPDAIGPRS